MGILARESLLHAGHDNLYELVSKLLTFKGPKLTFSLDDS